MAATESPKAMMINIATASDTSSPRNILFTKSISKSAQGVFGTSSRMSVLEECSCISLFRPTICILAVCDLRLLAPRDYFQDSRGPDSHPCAPTILRIARRTSGHPQQAVMAHSAKQMPPSAEQQSTAYSASSKH